MPDAEMLMGTGNLTELTEADTTGITALLTGLCSELAIRNVLIVQVSPHTRRTVQEHDAARRLMYAAKRDGGLPKGYTNALMGLHDRTPYANTPDGIAAVAAEVKDKNFRIEVAEDGIHVYNRDMHLVETDAFEAFPKLGVETDGGHAFYLGAELARAEIAFQLGKRYAQDNPLDWGISADRKTEDVTRLQKAGHTLGTRRPARGNE
jgi:dihydropteroate synthase